MVTKRHKHKIQGLEHDLTLKNSEDGRDRVTPRKWYAQHNRMATSSKKRSEGYESLDVLVASQVRKDYVTHFTG